MGVANRQLDRLGHRPYAGGARRRASPSPIRARALGKRVKPLAQRSAPNWSLPCDVEDIAPVDATYAVLDQAWAAIRSATPPTSSLHAIGFSDNNELKGRYADTTRENFSRTMVISCFSFTERAQRARRTA